MFRASVSPQFLACCAFVARWCHGIHGDRCRQLSAHFLADCWHAGPSMGFTETTQCQAWGYYSLRLNRPVEPDTNLFNTSAPTLQFCTQTAQTDLYWEEPTSPGVHHKVCRCLNPYVSCTFGSRVGEHAAFAVMTVLALALPSLMFLLWGYRAFGWVCTMLRQHAFSQVHLPLVRRVFFAAWEWLWSSWACTSPEVQEAYDQARVHFAQRFCRIASKFGFPVMFASAFGRLQEWSHIFYQYNEWSG